MPGVLLGFSKTLVNKIVPTSVMSLCRWSWVKMSVIGRWWKTSAGHNGWNIKVPKVSSWFESINSRWEGVTAFTFFVTYVSTVLPFPPLYCFPLCQSKSWSFFRVRPSCNPEMLFLSFEFVEYCFTGETLLWMLILPYVLLFCCY